MALTNDEHQAIFDLFRPMKEVLMLDTSSFSPAELDLIDYARGGCLALTDIICNPGKALTIHDRNNLYSWSKAYAEGYDDSYREGMKILMKMRMPIDKRSYHPGKRFNAYGSMPLGIRRG
jgi:hypothetical protein